MHDEVVQQQIGTEILVIDKKTCGKTTASGRTCNRKKHHSGRCGVFGNEFINTAEATAAARAGRARKQQAELDRQQALETGRALDQQLNQEVESLYAHIREQQKLGRLQGPWYGHATVHDGTWDSFLGYGKEILRGIAYGKKPRGDTHDEIVDADMELPYSEQKYFSLYVDSAVREMVEIGHMVQLTQPLVQWLLKILEQSIPWMETHRDNIEMAGTN